MEIKNWWEGTSTIMRLVIVGLSIVIGWPLVVAVFGFIIGVLTIIMSLVVAVVVLLGIIGLIFGVRPDSDSPEQ